MPIYVASKTSTFSLSVLIVPIDIGKSHIELIHLNDYHFNPTLSLFPASEPTRESRSLPEIGFLTALLECLVIFCAVTTM